MIYSPTRELMLQAKAAKLQALDLVIKSQARGVEMTQQENITIVQDKLSDIDVRLNINATLGNEILLEDDKIELVTQSPLMITPQLSLGDSEAGIKDDGFVVVNADDLNFLDHASEVSPTILDDASNDIGSVYSDLTSYSVSEEQGIGISEINSEEGTSYGANHTYINEENFDAINNAVSNIDNVNEYTGYQVV